MKKGKVTEPLTWLSFAETYKGYFVRTIYEEWSESQFVFQKTVSGQKEELAFLEMCLASFKRDKSTPRHLLANAEWQTGEQLEKRGQFKEAAAHLEKARAYLFSKAAGDCIGGDGDKSHFLEELAAVYLKAGDKIKASECAALAQKYLAMWEMERTESKAS